MVTLSQQAWARECQTLPADPLFSQAMLGNESRVAFLIGNSEYSEFPSLENPVRDVELLSKSLRRIGFEIIVGVNVNREDFGKCLTQFARLAQKADVAMFHFSGHAMQLDDNNYLLMREASYTQDVFPASVDLEPILATLRTAKSGILTLDACRNNPLNNGRKVIFASRSVPTIRSGLAPVGSQSASLGGNLIVAYATSPFQVATDGEGDVSPFSASLAKQIVVPGAMIQEVFANVSREVGEATNYGQTPWTRSSLTKPLRLNGSMRSEEVVAQSARLAATAEFEQMDPFEKGNPRDIMVARALTALPLGVDPKDQRFAAALDALTRALAIRSATLLGDPKGYYVQGPVDGRLAIGNFFDSDAEDAVPLELWDTISGRKVRTLLTVNDAQGLLTVSPDGKLVAAPDSSGAMHIWNASDGQLRAKLAPPNGTARMKWDKVWFTGSGQFLAGIGNRNELMVVWDLERGNYREIPSRLKIADAEVALQFDNLTLFDELTGNSFFSGTAEVTKSRSSTPFASFVVDGRLVPVKGALPQPSMGAAFGDGTALVMSSTQGEEIDTSLGPENEVPEMVNDFWLIDFKTQKVTRLGQVNGQVAMIDTSRSIAQILTIDVRERRVRYRYFDIRSGKEVLAPPAIAREQVIYSATKQRQASVSPMGVESYYFDPRPWQSPLPPDEVEDAAFAVLPAALAEKVRIDRLKLFE